MTEARYYLILAPLWVLFGYFVGSVLITLTSSQNVTTATKLQHQLVPCQSDFIITVPNVNAVGWRMLEVEK